MSRIPPLVMIVVLGGCVRFGFDSPCAGVDCGGHGTCQVADDKVRCSCAPGYHDIEGPTCAADLPPDLLKACPTTTLEDAVYSCLPAVAPGDQPALHLWGVDSSHSCGWLGIDRESGAISGSPIDDEVGSCTLAIVGDPGSSSPQAASVAIRVENVRPTLTIQSPATVDQDAGPTVICPDSAVQASDEGCGLYALLPPDAPPACAQNGAISIDAKTGAVTFAPAPGYVGRCRVKVQFDDGNGADGTASAELEVLVQPLAGFVSDASLVDESGTYHLLEIHLTAPALQASAIPYTVSGTADPKEHDLRSGSVPLAAGQSVVELQLRVEDDLVQESDETVVVTLQRPTGAGLASRTSHTVTIRDNDLPPLDRVVSIEAGQFNVCVQQQDGTIRCWGDNTHGQLGTGDTVSGNTPVKATALGTGATGLSLGRDHACAIFGGVGRCWGRNSHGQLGDDTTTSRSSPVTVTGLTVGVTSIAAGEFHSCAVAGGAAKCWGRNDQGQLGDGTNTQSKTPKTVQGLGSGVKQIAVGNSHSCAILADGSVRCWGLNTRSQLGDNDNTSKNAPITPTGLGAGAGVVGLSLGYDHSCALLSTGGLKCWGSNTLGQLGTGGSKKVPTDVDGLMSGVKKVYLKGQVWGGGASCALLASGGVKCWGTNTEGQVGDGTVINRSKPADVVGLTAGVIDIARTIHTSCAVLAQGGVRCWGTNEYYSLGNNKLPKRFSFPVRLPDLAAGSADGIAVGGRALMVEKSDGSLQTVGNNSFGELGVGDYDFRTSLSPVSKLSGTIQEMWFGTEHACVLIGGGVWCWGRNQQGEVGIGNKTMQPTPVQVPGLTAGVKTMTTGLFHTCAAPGTGGVKCWGWNHMAAVGDGTTNVMSVTKPTPVVGLDPAKVVDRLFAGYSHTCAVYPGGELKCWGWNSHGQLGNGTTTTAASAIAVPALTSGVVSGVGGYRHTCVLMTGGTVKCWGDNSEGQLGDGSKTTRKTPVDVPGLTNVVALSAGELTTCAVTQSGAVTCWGYNGLGTVGDMTFTGRTTPTPVHGLGSGVTAISVRFQACALLQDKSVRCWGDNSTGAFGDGLLDHHVLPVVITARP